MRMSYYPAMISDEAVALPCCVILPDGSFCKKNALFWVGRNFDDHTYFCGRHLPPPEDVALDESVAPLPPDS